MPGAEPISCPASSLFTGFFRVLTYCQNPIICILPLYYTTFYTTFPLNTSFPAYSHIIIDGSHGFAVYTETAHGALDSMSHFSLKVKLPDPIDRYCIYIISYPTMRISFCINHIVCFLFIKNILHGLTLVLPCLHFYCICLLRPQ